MEALIDAVEGVPTFPSDGGATWVSGLACDSRKVEKGAVFFALAGSQQDGHDYIGAAIERGAVAIVSESPSPADMKGQPLWVQVRKARAAMGRAADLFYGHPSGSMPVVSQSITRPIVPVGAITEACALR